MLKKNEEDLKQLVRSKFKEVTEAEDVKSVERWVQKEIINHLSNLILLGFLRSILSLICIRKDLRRCVHSYRHRYGTVLQPLGYYLLLPLGLVWLSGVWWSSYLIV